MARRRPAPLPHLRFLLLSDEDPSPLTQISAVETPQQLDWTSCDQLADSVYPLPPSGDDLKCWITVSSVLIHHQILRSSHSGFPCPYCWPVSGQRCGNCIFTRCQENESPTSSYSSTLGLTNRTKGSPFEPLQSTSLRAHSLKTILLLALASVKRVVGPAGPLHQPCLPGIWA